MLNEGCFVTGTDTGIGKTVVSAILTAGMRATYWKPVQTGAIEGTDADFVRTWVGAAQVAPEVYVFDEPVSPHLASAQTGAPIELNRLLERAASLPRPLVVEGAGGVLVPLAPHLLTAELIQALALPAIVVASTRLGTINHTLLTLEALAARRVSVAGVIMIGHEHESPWRSIETYGGAKVLGHVPWTDRFTPIWFRDAGANLDVPFRTPRAQEAECPTPL